MNNIKNLKSVGVIGRGKWGQKVIKALKSCSSIKYIVGKNVNFKKCSTKVDWIFILTPNRTHYRICKFFLKKKVNVFCEKPLTLNLKQATNLYSLAMKNRVLLYVDDVEIYKQKKFVLLKKKLYNKRKKRQRKLNFLD